MLVLLHSLAGRQTLEFLQAWQMRAVPMHCLGDAVLLGVLSWGGQLILFGFHWVRRRSNYVFSQWHWGVDEQQWVEVTELEAEEDFCVSPCCIEMWEIVGLF